MHFPVPSFRGVRLMRTRITTVHGSESQLNNAPLYACYVNENEPNLKSSAYRGVSIRSDRSVYLVARKIIIKTLKKTTSSLAARQDR